jgi:hypothetical protein
MFICMCDKVVSYVVVFWLFSDVNNLYWLFLLLGPLVLHILSTAAVMECFYSYLIMVQTTCCDVMVHALLFS